MRVVAGLGLAAFAVFAASAELGAGVNLPDGDWRTINRDLAATRFSPLKDVKRSNL